MSKMLSTIEPMSQECAALLKLIVKASLSTLHTFMYSHLTGLEHLYLKASHQRDPEPGVTCKQRQHTNSLMRLTLKLAPKDTGLFPIINLLHTEQKKRVRKTSHLFFAAHRHMLQEHCQQTLAKHVSQGFKAACF